MKWLAIIVSVVILAAVVAAFMVVGSPAKQRSVRFDQRKVTDLQNIQNQVLYYYQRNNKMPQSLSDLTGTVPKDPQSDNAYEYRPKTGLNYELCANFNLASTESKDDYYRYPSYANENWQHGAGRVCFDRAVDINTFKPVPIPL